MSFALRKEVNKVEREDAYFRWVAGIEAKTGLPRKIAPFDKVLRVTVSDNLLGDPVYHAWELDFDLNTAQPFSVGKMKELLKATSLAFGHGFRLDEKNASEVAHSIISRLYQYSTRSADATIYPFRWDREPEHLAFKAVAPGLYEHSVERFAIVRLGFNPDPLMETPFWDAFTKRLTNAQAVEAFIGMLFSLGMARSQYLYLCGPGGVGKSSLAEDFLAPMLGKAYCAVSSTDVSDKYFTSLIKHAGLVVVNEARANWPMSDKFKSLTGDGLQTMHGKYKDSYLGQLHCRFMFLSNKPLELENEDEHTRRVLYSELKPIPEGERLTAKQTREAYSREAPGIIGKCLMAMHDLKSGDVVKVTIDTTTKLIEEADLEIESWITGNLVITTAETDRVKASEIINATTSKHWGRIKRWVELNPAAGLKVKRDNGKTIPRETWLVGALRKATGFMKKSR